MILDLANINLPILKGETVVIVISGVTNPISFKPSDSFSFVSDDGTSFLNTLNTLSTGVTVTNQASSLLTVSVSNTNNFLDELSVYTFRLTQSTILPSNSFIRLTFGVGYDLTGSIQANSASNFALSSSTPVISSQTILIQGSSFTSTFPYQFSLTNIKNPKTAGATITLETLDDQQFIISQVATPYSFNLDCILPCKTCNTPNSGNCSSCYLTGSLVQD